MVPAAGTSEIVKHAVTSFKFILIASITMAVVFLIFVSLIIADFPSDKDIHSCLVTKMYQVNLCPSSASYVRLRDISPYLQKSVVLTEDASFWQHQGFDFEEIRRSLKKNLQTGKYRRGGSTISQQLAKNMFLSGEKTLTRKLKEAIITLRLEKNLSKKEILERYLNVVHWGPGIFGVKAAAAHYFHKQPNQLSILESAFLTFLLPSPEKYSQPYMHGEITPFARERLTQIIDNLYQYQRISDTEFASARADLAVLVDNSKNYAGTRVESKSALPVEKIKEQSTDQQPSEEEAEPEDD